MALDADTRQQLIETVRRFVAERLRPLEARVAEDDRIPDAVLDEMKALGLFGLSIPEEYGGLDLSMEDECLVMMEMGRTSPAFRSSFGTNVGIGSQGLVMFGDDEQKARYLPKIATGETITSFALTLGGDGAQAGLKLDSGLSQALDYRAVLRVEGGERPGSVCTVLPLLASYEVWPYAIASVTLSGFATRATNEVVCDPPK